MINAESNAEFHFNKNDIYKLADAVQLADEFVMYNGLIVESLFVLCIQKYFHIGIVRWFFTLKTSPRDLHHNKSHYLLDLQSMESLIDYLQS